MSIPVFYFLCVLFAVAIENSLQWRKGHKGKQVGLSSFGNHRPASLADVRFAKTMLVKKVLFRGDFSKLVRYAQPFYFNRTVFRQGFADRTAESADNALIFDRYYRTRLFGRNNNVLNWQWLDARTMQ